MTICGRRETEDETEDEEDEDEDTEGGEECHTWSEATSAMGLPSRQSVFHPCTFCNCLKDAMFNFSGVSFTQSPFARPPNLKHVCAEREIVIRLEGEDRRRLIMVKGFLRYDK